MIIKPPSTFFTDSRPKVFLAGSIEMGKADDWQSRVANYKNFPSKLCFFNPRRDVGIVRGRNL